MRASVALTLLMMTSSTALAGGAGGFDIVIPGRAGVPIIIDGIDASYAVVEGQWGLGKGEQVQPTIYGGRYIDPVPNVGRYYPSLGHTPGYGRREIEPPSYYRPQRAESYHESWSARSTPQLDIPANPPPVIVAPQINEDWNHHRYPRPRR